jgi:SAM-dependent methyltransferase
MMKIPELWSDAAGWDTYYMAHRPNFEKVEKYHLEDDLRFAAMVLEAPHKRVWFPGCGLDLSPWLYANLGCDVVATDISPYAISVQNELLYEVPMEALEKLPNVLKEMELPKAETFVHPAMFVHDMRKPFSMEKVDVVVNRRAFHGFSWSEKVVVAQEFFNAVFPGGVLVCETLNVQGQDRSEMENALLQAGFFIPGLEAEQWYRQQLDTTGIVYAMVMGNPVIPQWGQYVDKSGKEQENVDRATLNSFGEAYIQRRKANAAQDNQTFREGIDKLAYLIYNTG